MAAIITEKFRQSNADAFSADIASSKYYMFVGKSQPWTSEGATSDSNPPNLSLIHISEPTRLV